MPTKKRRVGFIPRSDVLDLINQLSYESNLSFSKVINILVEEALYKRGLFNIKKDEISHQNKTNSEYDKSRDKIRTINREFNHNFKNNLLREQDINFKEVEDEPFDNEIYSKFLLFLKFQERMKKRKD